MTGVLASLMISLLADWITSQLASQPAMQPTCPPFCLLVCQIRMSAAQIVSSRKSTCNLEFFCPLNNLVMKNSTRGEITDTHMEMSN